ncbi:ribosomal protein L7/L12 [Candidatus Vidania fulgoroideorum]
MKLKKIVKSIENLTSIEILNLINKLEEKFNIQHSPLKKDKDVVKDKFNLVLNSVKERIPVIRLIRELTNLDLQKSKSLTEDLPKIILKNQEKTKSLEIKNKFKSLGADLSLE